MELHAVALPLLVAVVLVHRFPLALPNLRALPFRRQTRQLDVLQARDALQPVDVLGVDPRELAHLLQTFEKSMRSGDRLP